jgi:regulatory protein
MTFFQQILSKLYAIISKKGVKLMAKITRITAQQNRKGRYNIFLDDGNGEEYAFSIDEDILIKFMLRKGMELDSVQIEELKRHDSTQKFYVMAINLLSYRIRSEKEIVDYLQRKEADLDQINEIVSKLKKEGYINDQEFAMQFVRSRINTTSKGPLLIKKELMEKGVGEREIEESLKLYSREIQEEKVQKWIEQKLKSDNKKSFQQQLQGLQATLVQKGFIGEVIQEKLLEAKNNRQDDQKEREAVIHQGLKLLEKYRKKDEGYILKQKIKAALYRKGFQGEHINFFLNEYVQE